MTVERITRRRDFKRVFRTARRVEHRSVVLFVVDNGTESTARAAVSVVRRAGNAVERNRAKRIFWEVLRKNEANIVGRDVVVIVRSARDVNWTDANAVIDSVRCEGNYRDENEHG